MSQDPRAAVEAVLEPGEKLLWSGAPDREVMLKTLGKKKNSPFFTLLFFGVIAAVLWTQRDLLGMVLSGNMVVPQNMWMPLAGFAALAGIIFFLSRRQATGHVDNLAYALTDRRLFILRKGEIMESRAPAEMKWVELRERRGAEGYHDIIWAKRPIRRSSDSGKASPLERERSRIGFKALADGPAVYERIEQWRGKHQASARDLAREAVTIIESGEAERVTHPRLGSSIAVPPGWKMAVRKKTFPFGKTRMDMNADKWYEPDRDDQWNVFRITDPGNAEVMVEIARTEPVATFEDMADPKVPGFIEKVMNVVETEKHVTIGGIDGFRVDQELSGMGDTEMAIGQSSDKVQTRFRQVVLHDGTYQYYLTATWPKGEEDQAAACQAILDSFRGCTALVA